jgi:hypothetical protein
MDFSPIDYLDEDACYAKLVELLHPEGLACRRCGERQRVGMEGRPSRIALDPHGRIAATRGWRPVVRGVDQDDRRPGSRGPSRLHGVSG